MFAPPMLRLTRCLCRLFSLFSGLTHLKTSGNQGWKGLLGTAPTGRLCLAAPPSPPPRGGSLRPPLPSQHLDMGLMVSTSVSLGWDRKAWHRGGTQMFTGQIYTPATARASEVNYRSGRNHPILEGEYGTSIHLETCFLSTWPSSIPPALPMGELLLVDTESWA